MDPDSRPLRVTVADGGGRRIRDGGLARWLAAISPARVCGEIAIALVTDGHMRALNQQYRRKNAPTDVLSFPAEPSMERSRGDRVFLGDIVIASGVAGRQARESGHSYATELRVLALHGLLHLLGYDHDDPRDRGRMARAEARLRRKGGIREGLIGRSLRTAGPSRSTRVRRRAARPAGRK